MSALPGKNLKILFLVTITVGQSSIQFFQVYSFKNTALNCNLQ